MHLTADGIIRRLLVYRLMRYRFAWLAFGLLGLYLAAMLIVVIGSQRQMVTSGTIAGCRPLAGGTDGSQGELFQLRERKGVEFELTAANFQPAPPSLCARRDQPVTLRYETNALRDPDRVDELVIADPITGATATYRDRTRTSFELVKRVRLAVFGGGMALVSLIMLGVGVWWKRFGDVARRTRPNRRRERPATIPAHFTAQVEQDMRWLQSLPWGASAATERRSAYLAFQRGVALVRGWDGNEETLTRGVGLLIHCPPALAYTGAAEAALQLASYDVLTCARPGLDIAHMFIRRALEREPDSLDARLTYIHILAAYGSLGDTARLARATKELHAVRDAAPRLRRLPSAAAAVSIARRDDKQAIAALRRAIGVTPNEEERVALVDTLARVVLRTGDLRQALRLFVTLSLPEVTEGKVPLTAGQRRLSLSVPLPTTRNAATLP